MTNTVPNIQELIQKKDTLALTKALRGLSAHDAAVLLNRSSPNDQALIFSSLPPELMARSFKYIPKKTIKTVLLPSLSSLQKENLFAAMHPDDRTAFFEKLPKKLYRKFKTLNSSINIDSTFKHWLIHCHF